MRHRDCDDPTLRLAPRELDDSGREDAAVRLPTGLKAVAGGRRHAFSTFVCRNAVLHKCPSEFCKVALFSVGLPTVGHCFRLLWRIKRDKVGSLKIEEI
jgi:hypothetical protein